MAASSAGYHEDQELLKPGTLDRHRAIASLMEELEAVDWYDQRVDATHDEALRAVLAHNRDEEKEHAAMVLEWLRRQDAVLDQHLREYLFIDGNIVGKEEAVEQAEAAGSAGSPASAAAASDGSLGIGSLRGQVRR